MNINKGKKNIIEKIIDCLKSIYDPEISINIIELRLIYDIQISKNNNIKIIMTLTTPNCPVADNFLKEVKQKIKNLNYNKFISIVLTFDPIWNYKMLSEEIRFQLELN